MAEIKLKRLNVVKVVDSEAKADALISKGFEVVVEKKTPVKTLDEMTVVELEAYAAEKDIDLGGLNNKAEKLAKIKEVEGGE